MKLSVIIPSWKDPLLAKTINSLLETSELNNQLEIIAILDGYWPKPDLIVNNPRVRYVHLGKNRGMRGAINAGVAVSRGEFIMRSDEHCMFPQGFDRIMVEGFGDNRNWIMTAIRYFLNPVKWEVMKELKPVIYEKLAIRDDIKFEGQKWHSRGRERRKILIDETMAMQGSVWVMPRKWWDDVIVELQTEGYGPLYQDSHEMIFKTWKAGGKLMLNKNTWFAHKHWTFPRTHNYGKSDAQPGWTYSLNLWREYYENEVKLKWGL